MRPILRSGSFIKDATEINGAGSGGISGNQEIIRNGTQEVIDGGTQI